MGRSRHQPGGLCLLLLLLCQFMEDRSAQGKRGGMRGGSAGAGARTFLSSARSLLRATLLSEDPQTNLATQGWRTVGGLEAVTLGEPSVERAYP